MTAGVCTCGVPARLCKPKTALPLPVPERYRGGCQDERQPFRLLPASPVAALPVAIAQPRNRIPLWMRWWERGLHDGRMTLVRGFAHLALLFLVITPLLYAWRAWDGEPPRVFSPRKELER